MAGGGLSAEPLTQQSGFNWIFLVELFMCGILTLFFLFYFNRLFATLVSYGIRAYTWHHYRAYVDIQALQFSFLGGRIFFKGIRYHGHNQTILVHGGYLTWQYWIPNTKEAEIFVEEAHARRPGSSGSGGSAHEEKDSSVDREEKGGAQTQRKLPCRITMKVSGLEAFLYNRSPAYDAIVANMFNRTSQEGGLQGVATNDTHASATSSGIDGKNNARESVSERHAESSLQRDTSCSKQTVRDCKPAEPPMFLRAFPIHVECNKGAVVVGNENTTCIVTAQFERASGEFDAAGAGPLDVYQQLFKFDVIHPVVHMRPNPDFKGTQLVAAARIKEEEAGIVASPVSNYTRSLPPTHRPWHRLKEIFSFRNMSLDSVATHSEESLGRNHGPATPLLLPGQERWQGLKRYLDQGEHNEHDEWDAVEYARTSQIADCPSVRLSFYWDIPGPVPSEVDSDIKPASRFDINGSAPPAYGLNLHICGGIINYGPWADRQRANLQSVFFPASYVDAVPAQPLRPGQTRLNSIFNLNITMEEDVILRVPTREPSKDWKWKGKASGGGKADGERDGNRTKPRIRSVRARRRSKGVQAHNVRPFGWFDIKVLANSTVSYEMDMVANRDGYRNALSVDLRGSEISSSVNHGLLWRSGELSVNGDLSNPLGWNHLRRWLFGITTNDLELFLLRDHVFLLVDLIADWGSGPPPDYFTFTPYEYILNLDFNDFKLYLNTNDCNIVNNPSDLDDNDFIILFGKMLKSKLTIPLVNYRPAQNNLKFSVEGDNLGLELSMPSKNTTKTFVEDKDVARLGHLYLAGNHSYYSQTSHDLTDRLFIDIRGDRFSLDLYGFLVRHFMKIKDNYFGEDLHFKTLEEYQGAPQEHVAADTVADQASNKSNDLDVILCITADNVAVVLPNHLYSAENGIRIDVAFANCDLRFTNYYMDLMVDFSPLHVSLKDKSWKDAMLGSVGQTELFIDSLTIGGHRLFGLPPIEPTYMCNWDFDVGSVRGECSSEFIKRLVAAGQGFAFTLDDFENAVPLADPPVINDVTFLRLNTQEVKIWLHVANEALLLSTDPVSLSFNDLAGGTFSQRLKLWVPNLLVACVDATSASRHRATTWQSQIVTTHAYIKTTISMNMLSRKLAFSEEREKQQAHIREHDSRTHRTPWLLMEGHGLRPVQSFQLHQPTHEPAMVYPPVPSPITLLHETSSISSYSDSASSSSSSSLSFYTGLAGRGSWNVRNRSHRTSRSRSAESLKNSIRSNPAKSSKNRHLEPQRGRQSLQPSSQHLSRSPSYDPRLPDDDERARRGLPPSSVALRSPLISPYFPLNAIEPDLSDVPSLPRLNSSHSQRTADTSVTFNDIASKTFDEGFVHRSFIISLEPGLQVHCTPDAVSCVANLLDDLGPKTPDELLDAFQIDVMTNILDRQKRKEGKGKSTEISLKIPSIHLRFVNQYTQLLDDITVNERDQYDLVLDRFSIAARVKKFPEDAADQNTLSLHTTLGAFDLSVSGRPQSIGADEVAVRACLDDLLLWVSDAKATSLNLSFKSFETSTASGKIEYLASLIHRTALLVEDYSGRFSKLEKLLQNRLRILAYNLTLSGLDISDPPFLTRPSYALRAARDHLRNHDSWKIISRLRYIHQELSRDDRLALLRTCLNSPSCVADAQDKVISSWDQWRTWDLAHVKNSLAMRKLWGTADGVKKLGKPTSKPVTLDIRSSMIRVVIDPGPQQSDLALELLSINVLITPPLATSGLGLNVETPKKSTLIQSICKNIAVRVNWEICELLEALLRLFHSDTREIAGDQIARLSSKSQTPPDQGNKSHDEISELHFIVSTDTASLSLDTINLRSAYMARELKQSLVMRDETALGQGVALTLLFHADAAASEMSFRSRLLLWTRADAPSLYIAHKRKPASQPDQIRIAGASKFINIEVQDELLGLIEAADAFLVDEVVFFQRLAAEHAKSSTRQPTQPNKPSGATPELTVALLMDAYEIHIALLESLTWSIAGGIGRVSATPALEGHVSINVDFDLEKHRHQMLSGAPKNRNTIASLDLPPVNGHVVVVRSDQNTSVKVSSTIETIVLDASALHGMFTTLNRPEMEGVFHAIREDIGVLAYHFKEAFPQSSSEVASKRQSDAPRPVVYDVNTILAGLHVLASAPAQAKEGTTSKLLVKIGPVDIRALNTTPDGQVILPFPEIHSHLQHVGVHLTISDGAKEHEAGNISLAAVLHCTFRRHSAEEVKRAYRLKIAELEINLFTETASAVVDLLNHLQDRIKNLDLSREKKYLQRLRQPKRRPPSIAINAPDPDSHSSADMSSTSSGLFGSAYSVELLKPRISWIVGGSVPPYQNRETEDLVLSFRRINLSTRTEDTARLMIENMQLQMVPASADKFMRSQNSALLPEVVFNASYSSTKSDRRLAFQAAGKSLDLRLESRFVLGVSVLQRSMYLAGEKFRTASAIWGSTKTPSGTPRENVFGKKRLASLVVDADFAGAVVQLQGSSRERPTSDNSGSRRPRAPTKGRYGQFSTGDSTASTSLRAPGLAVKVQYIDGGQEPSLNGELKIDASSNTLYPSVVPLIADISDSVKEIVKMGEDSPKPSAPSLPKPSAKNPDDENIITADPSTILGRTQLNLGIRICKQEFSLSCQPIARVAAMARFEDVYVTVNSVRSVEYGHFFAISGNLEQLHASVQHVYSRESTFAIGVQSIVLSLMNSKHVSGTSGISAILKISPTKTQINARQLQDFLLFREIWIPPEIRQSSDKADAAAQSSESTEYLVQRYHQVAASAAFPWNATIAIQELLVDLDLGQSIGKSTLKIKNVWASSKKSSNWEQNLCVGAERIGAESVGRLSGFLDLAGLRVRTSISWPEKKATARQTPLIQASIGIEELRIKAGFDYQLFAVADIAAFEFLMYNVRERDAAAGDRLVSLLDGAKVHVFFTSTSASQGLALFQALERLVQENQSAYAQSLKDIEKFLRRKSSTVTPRSTSQPVIAPSKIDEGRTKAPISLHTDVVVTLGSVTVGAFPNVFTDQQILILQASDTQARFMVNLDRNNRIHSALGMTLGQLSVALASITQPKQTKHLPDLTVEDVVSAASSSRGGTILRVPKVLARMHTWNAADSNTIEYIFKSSFEGKVDVGWNYSRISFIRNMWSNHSRSLASRLGKPLPESAVKITAASTEEAEGRAGGEGALAREDRAGERDKITAEVNLPQSRYEYVPLEPPVIETPQLRDMGEATPPLEWIGLHRDRLPNVTHQIVIVTLLEVAKEVEDAYGRILGAS